MNQVVVGRVAAQDTSGKMRAFYLQVGAESLQSFDKLPPLPGGTRTDYQSESYGVNSLGEVVGYAHERVCERVMNGSVNGSVQAIRQLPLDTCSGGRDSGTGKVRGRRWIGDDYWCVFSVKLKGKE